MRTSESKSDISLADLLPSNKIITSPPASFILFHPEHTPSLHAAPSRRSPGDLKPGRSADQTPSPIVAARDMPPIAGLSSEICHLIPSAYPHATLNDPAIAHASARSTIQLTPPPSPPTPSPTSEGVGPRPRGPRPRPQPAWRAGQRRTRGTGGGPADQTRDGDRSGAKYVDIEGQGG